MRARPLSAALAPLLVLACAAEQKMPPPAVAPPPGVAAPAPSTTWVARTGAPELDESRSAREPRDRWPDYARRLRQLHAAGDDLPRLVPLARRPRRLSAAALYGFPLSVGDLRVCWAVDRRRGQGFTLVVDENANGDLDDDRLRPFAAGEAPTIHATVTVQTKVGGLARAVSFPLKVTMDPQGAFTYESTLRHGTIALPTRAVRFAVSGRSGTYAQPWDAVGHKRFKLHVTSRLYDR